MLSAIFASLLPAGPFGRMARDRIRESVRVWAKIGLAGLKQASALLLLTSVLVLSAGRAEPSTLASQELIRIPGIPPEISYITNLVLTPRGWVALAGDGLLTHVGGPSPTIVSRPPTPGELRVLVYFKDRLLVAGDGAAYFFREGVWTNLGIDDNFYAAVPADDLILLVGRRAVYSVREDGAWNPIQPLTTARLPYATTLRGVPHIFAARDGVFRWSNGRLVDAGQTMAWAMKAEVLHVQELDEDRLFAASSLGFFLSEPAGTRLIAPDVFIQAIQETIYDATLVGDTLITATYHGGIAGYSVQRDEELWRVPPTALTGNITYARYWPGTGYVLAAADNLYLLPILPGVRFRTLPKGDLNFSYASGEQAILGLSTGVYRLPGLEKISDEPWISHVVRGDGTPIRGGMAKLEIGDVSVSLPGRRVSAVAPLAGNAVAALQPHGVSIVDGDGRPIRLELASTPTSLASNVDGTTLLIGTVAGVYRFDHSGNLHEHFGRGISKAFSFQGLALASDETGAIYNETGTVLARVPSQSIVDATEWKGRLALIGKFESGNAWVGTLDLATSTWQPLDLPLPSPPALLTASGGELYVIGRGMLLQVADGHPLTSASLPTVRMQASQSMPVTPTGAALSPVKDGLVATAPPPRLWPWRNAEYTLKLNSERPVRLLAGAEHLVKQFPWGESELQLRAEWAGLASESEVTVVRVRPWWARTPGFLLYAAGLALLGYAAVKLRTRHLERRARRLQVIIDEKTSELRKTQKAREEFFSTLSHEIRNPLNGVVGLCEILNRASGNQDPERQRMLLRTLQGCSDQLRSVIDDVLDFTRIDRGEIHLRAEPFEVNAAVRNAVRTADAELTRSSIESLSSDTWVLGDEGKVRQIITNLVSNALKHGIPPEAHIHVRAAPGSENKLHLSIAVVNTGPTIPREELDMIFSGFIQGSDATRRRIQGTGLGLAVSRRFAKAMGGSLLVQSENQLTTFELHLDLPSTNAPTVALPPSLHLPKRRVLAIEDEAFNRLVLQHVLNDIGCTADWAADGAAALQKIQENSYDLILTDLALPDITGFELARQIRLTAKQPIPPIIAVTAYCTPDKLRQAQEAGILSVVTKPISAAKLSGVLAEVV